MKQANVSFRTDAKKMESLDAIAAALNRDRNYVLNEAIAAYLELYQWQIKHIKEGLRQAEKGDLRDHKEALKILESF